MVNQRDSESGGDSRERQPGEGLRTWGAEAEGEDGEVEVVRLSKEEFL